MSLIAEYGKACATVRRLRSRYFDLARSIESTPAAYTMSVYGATLTAKAEYHRALMDARSLEDSVKAEGRLAS